MALSRKESKKEFTWDLSQFSNDAHFEKELKLLKKEEEHHFPTLNGFRNDVKNHLIPLLENYFSLLRKFDAIYTYAHLKHDEDVADTKNSEMYKKATSLFERFQTESSWIEPAILAMEPKELQQVMHLEAAKPFRVYLSKLALMKAHVLSEKEEKILALASTPTKAVSKAFSLLNNADMKFDPATDSQSKKHELTHGSYSVLLKSYDRELRKSAFTNLHQKFQDFENTLCELLSGCVQAHDFQAKARGYKSCLESALFPHQIDTSVYHQLIATLSSHVAPLHRYLQLRKKRLKLDELHVYDLFVPIVEDVSSHYSYEEAVDIVLESYAPLGKPYLDIITKGLKQERWVDVYENKGKRSGAYSSGCYDSFPYILLNYQGTFSDVMTLSHEIGHSMHSFFSNRSQEYQNSSYAIFVAEVASTFNEELTFRKLLKRAKTPKERIYILSQKIDSIRSTLYRQTLFAEFELKIHEMAEKQIPMTASSLKEIYLQLNKKYYGTVLTLDPLLAVECFRIPHFYYNFYVYQYATGISAAYFLAEKVLAQEEQALEKYLNFLSMGSSKFPLELLKDAGVDMHQKDPIVHLVERFSYLVDCLEKEFEQLDCQK